MAQFLELQNGTTNVMLQLYSEGALRQNGLTLGIFQKWRPQIKVIWNARFESNDPPDFFFLLFLRIFKAKREKGKTVIDKKVFLQFFFKSSKLFRFVGKCLVGLSLFFLLGGIIFDCVCELITVKGGLSIIYW